MVTSLLVMPKETSGHPAEQNPNTYTSPKGSLIYIYIYSHSRISQKSKGGVFT